jgi:hypothetical protein
MLYREIVAVCSQIHTKHVNTLCGQNVEFLNIKPGGTYSDHWDLEPKTDKRASEICNMRLTFMYSMYSMYSIYSMYCIFLQHISPLAVQFSGSHSMCSVYVTNVHHNYPRERQKSRFCLQSYCAP